MILLRPVFIITIIAVAMIGIMIPNADAYWVNGVEIISPGHVAPGYVAPSTEPSVDYSIHISDPNVSGKIILSENWNLKLYRGGVVIFL